MPPCRRPRVPQGALGRRDLELQHLAQSAGGSQHLGVDDLADAPPRLLGDRPLLAQERVVGRASRERVERLGEDVGIAVQALELLLEGMQPVPDELRREQSPLRRQAVAFVALFRDNLPSGAG